MCRGWAFTASHPVSMEPLADEHSIMGREFGIMCVALVMGSSYSIIYLLAKLMPALHVLKSPFARGSILNLQGEKSDPMATKRLKELWIKCQQENLNCDSS